VTRNTARSFCDSWASCYSIFAVQRWTIGRHLLPTGDWGMVCRYCIYITRNYVAHIVLLGGLALPWEWI